MANVVYESIKALETRYPQLTSTAANTWSTGATLVFKSRAERQKAEASALTEIIKLDLRALVDEAGLDSDVVLKTITFADMDEINAAGGAYYFYK